MASAIGNTRTSVPGTSAHSPGGPRQFRQRWRGAKRVVGAFVSAGVTPPDRVPEAVAWLFPLIGTEDRVNTIRIWQMAMPAEVFGGAVRLARQAVGDGWAELAERIPGLPLD